MVPPCGFLFLRFCGDCALKWLRGPNWGRVRKWPGKPPKKQGFFILAEPLKSLERRENCSKKQGIPRTGKNKEFQKNKERKERECTLVPVFGHKGTSESTLVLVFGRREHPPKSPSCQQFTYPDPPTLAFLKKARETPKKARVILLSEPLKSLEKKGKTHKKAREIGKRKKQGNRKKQGLEGQGMGSLVKGFCGKFAENLRKFAKKYILLRQERVRKVCGKSCGICAKFCCNDPFPDDPKSELLILETPFANPRTFWNIKCNGSREDSRVIFVQEECSWIFFAEFNWWRLIWIPTAGFKSFRKIFGKF